MQTKPLKTGIKVAGFIAAINLANSLFRALLGWSNEYIPGTGAHNWIDYWAAQIAFTVIISLFAFFLGFMFRLVKNKISTKST
jgi:hypothetical protein